MAFWIVEKFDSAIMGCRSGEQRQQSVAGPFEEEHEAHEKRRLWRPHGCYYYAVVESEEEPETTKNSYEFTEPDEFEEDPNPMFWGHNYDF